MLIEPGGPVAKSGLIALTGDDRAVILGALAEIAARLRSEDSEQTILLWRRRGKRMFENNETD
ncbi:conjugal transfer protein TraD [Sphingomonas oligophenolica]|uniref:Conjugal transfer protein TraD n=1 Tax=Sphingomonas oligophenolica TaxID=301154 RepID=A0ABU9YAS2_9SPHN